eukprot:TRINITY_DN24416_c0_g1_i1.p1 TRINITY_DN24416_c0_g1~~TRINITY_DN24416_c0_g1_i1.p1  ORF type:complete len:468 (-),score=61.04 TRINITY_DN24416_c0_g1_i1:360-1685(-)
MAVCSANVDMRTVIESRLVYCPDLAGTDQCELGELAIEKAVVVAATDLCDIQYTVPHYAPSQVGACFGPLGLDRVLRFCLRLDKALEKDSTVILRTGVPGCIKARSNVATLLGAYLALNAGWSTERIETVLGKADADLRYICSWVRDDGPNAPRTLRVRDTWSALEHAKRLGWVNTAKCGDESLVDDVCNDWSLMSSRYDASWLVPNRILVCADPMSTVSDPSPQTVGSLAPSKDGKAEQKERAETWESNSSDCEYRQSSTPSTAASDGETNHFSTISEARLYMKAPNDFASFFQVCGTSLLVRANLVCENGLPSSYDPKEFTSRGIEHMDLPLIDRNGAVPSWQYIQKLIRKSDEKLSVEAVALYRNMPSAWYTREGRGNATRPIRWRCTAREVSAEAWSWRDAWLCTNTTCQVVLFLAGLDSFAQGASPPSSRRRCWPT